MIRRRLNRLCVVLRNVLCVFVILSMIFIYQITRYHESEVINKIPRTAIKYLDFEETVSIKPLDITTLKRLIRELNSDERILNLEIFGPLKPDTPIFVIFVEEFSINFKYLLVSLSQLWGIENILIIFSHMYFNVNVNNIIKTIDFARVLQIFYPYSVQLYPNEFPGKHSNDCEHNMDIELAEAVNCSGAFTPDIHGRYREPLKAQKKHYWWWTANKVFENLTLSTGYTGTIIFLEDDLFLLDDFIYMILHMTKICSYFPQCDLISLETPSYSRYTRNNTWSVELKTWNPVNHASVLAFDSSIWNSIASHYNLFCSIDDYSWSRSLFYLSLNREDGNRFRVMTSNLPRAFKTSISSFIGKIFNCEIPQIVFKIMNVQKRKNQSFFPAFIEVYQHIELEHDDFIIFDHVANDGGWNDPRDKEMCHNLTENKIKKVIMHMEQEFHDYKNTY